MSAAIKTVDIGRMQRSYSAVLYAGRICQLSFFMLLFELLLSLWNFGIEGFVWAMESLAHAIGDGQSPSAPDFSDINTSIGPLSLAILP